MPSPLSKKTRRIGLSPTLQISALAERMRGEGVDVLDFSAGQPDFPTPETVCEAGKRAIDAGHTRYTINSGLIELRQAIAERIRSDHDLAYGPEQILVSPGAKASLYFACMALLDPGDEVLLPSPYWVSYPEQIGLVEARPVIVETDSSCAFKLRVEQLEQSLTSRSRMLVLNYPSNPTGACYSRAELEPLARFCVQHDLWVLADEIYSKLLFDGREFTTIAALGEEIQARTVMIDGMSKSYSMTGWRLGYAAGPKEVIAGMARVQSHVTSNATSVSQWAGVEALSVPDSLLRERAAEFERRRDDIVARLRGIQGIRCVEPEGSFYVFPDFSGTYGKTADGDEILDDHRMARYLLEVARVAVVPGGAFGAPGHLRISYAVSRERIAEGMDRIAAALERLERD